MSTTKEFILFQQDKLSFKNKFYLLMDMLVSNQSSKEMEAFIFIGIYYIQIIAGFFATQVGVLDIVNSKSDKVINYIEQIFRLKSLFKNNYNDFKIVLYLFSIVLIVLILLFTLQIVKTRRNTFYSINHSILNYAIKLFIYVAYNIINDFCISNFCFEDSPENNPNFPGVTCSFSARFTPVIISVLLFLVSNYLNFFVQFFYTDSFYLSNSPYSKISCGYEIVMGINNLIYSILLIETKYLTKEIFLIYNLISSALLLRFYFNSCVYYSHHMSVLGGMFHILYFWTSLFFLVFYFINFNEKSLVYLISAVIVLYFYFTLKYKLDENILLSTPFYKITNKHYLLYYIKKILDKINQMNKNPEEKALLTGILQMHSIECPNLDCLTKNKKKIYLPISNEWSDRSKQAINDNVFLLHFVIVIMNFFLKQNYYSPELLINESLYYLEILGNYCQAMFYYKKVKESKMNYQEQFSFMRLEIAISKTLVAKFKPSTEICSNLEDLDVTYYFKYVDLSQQLFDEMNNDVNLSLEFWRSFKASQTDNKIIDFNKIFHLTDKIRITKAKVDQIWMKLYNIFNGVNDLFDLYLTYTEQVNDDDLLKRDLDEIKRKSENSAEFIQQNFYSILFNKETGIVICNGDKGSEGMIEKTNNEIEPIFKYKPEELKGMNIAQLMPRLFAKEHKAFMSNYFEIGEKKVIDNKDIKSFGKDKDNSLMVLKICVKLFPILNENVYFVGMIIKENIDDVIFIDSSFDIQGMSAKLMNVLNIDNKQLFMDNDIPFYLICKKFVNFYKIFLHSKRKSAKGKRNITSQIQSTSEISSLSLNEGSGSGGKKRGSVIDEIQKDSYEVYEEDSNQKEELRKENTDDSNENIEINENIELEYEIKIPQYIYDYANAQNKKEKKELKMQQTQNGTEQAIDEGGYHNFNETIEEFGESDLLVDDDNTKENNANNSQTPNQAITLVSQTPTHTQTPMQNCKEGNNDFNRQSDEEKEFTHNIMKAKDLFENGKFTELEDFIDLSNKDSSMNDFKFNFTFDKYKYGNKQTAYIVRCIDNKNDGARSNDDSQGEENDPKILLCRKVKNESLKFLYELLDTEKKELLGKFENFLQLSLDNKEFQSVLARNKEEIYQMSMIHGHKKEEIVEDENSSQSSQAGYNNDLCKKNHIEEIRSNIMKNVSNFYTLKYIKLTALLLFVASGVFLAVFLLTLSSIYDDLKIVSRLNIDLYNTTLWISNLISTIISLATMQGAKSGTLKGGNSSSGQPLHEPGGSTQNYEFDSYIEDEGEYFGNLTEFAVKWYTETITNFGELEYKIGNYIDNSTLFWCSQTVTYNFPELTDDESYPLGTNQVLTDINSMLNNEYFTIDTNVLDNMSKEDQEFMSYIKYLAVENSYSNLIPSQFDKLKTVPPNLQDYNSKKMDNILIMIIIYFVVVAIIYFCYFILLYFTNKNMGEGLEKVTKIKIEKIEDTIKKIEGFYDILKRYRDKDMKGIKAESKIEQTVDPALPDKASQQKNSNNNSSIGSGFSADNKRHKKLQILYFAYYQLIIIGVVLCGFLIPLYILCREMIISTNKIIDVQDYLFGKLLIASISTVEIKCMMSNCDVKNELEYSTLVNKSEIQSIVQAINLFPELDDFYNNKFLINACDAAFDKKLNETVYESCMKDVLIQSANNTDSLLKLIDETVGNIKKEQEMKVQEDKEFDNVKLYNTSSFNELETIFYKYVAPVSYNVDSIITSSLKVYLETQFIVLSSISASLVLCMVVMAVWIGVFGVKRLVHLLSVSRCILKIIPTIVINNTQDLELWIENKY